MDWLGKFKPYLKLNNRQVSLVQPEVIVAARVKQQPKKKQVRKRAMPRRVRFDSDSDSDNEIGAVIERMVMMDLSDYQFKQELPPGPPNTPASLLAPGISRQVSGGRRYRDPTPIPSDEESDKGKQEGPSTKEIIQEMIDDDQI